VRRSISRVLLLATAVAVSHAAVFTVTNTNNSGPGSLHQAILDNQNTPGPNVIEFAIAGTPPYVIRPEGQFLPPLKGPVVLRMKPDGSAPASAAGGRGGGILPAARPVTELAPRVVLDGSNLVKPRVLADCPGATFNWNAGNGEWEKSDVRGQGPNVRGYYGPGLAVQDSHDVEISGVEIRGFCVGIVTVRSSNVYIHDVKVVDNQGAAGVMFTGDDGKAGRTDLSFNNRLVHSLLLDNGDGFEFTRGTHDSLIQSAYIGLTKPLPEDGNAIEFATSGDNNAVIGNTFTKYVDTAVTVGGNGHTIRDNKFTSNRNDGLRASGSNLLIIGNTFMDNGGSAMLVSGAGTKVLDNVVTGNEGKGIIVSSAGVTLSRNSIFNNAHLGIDVATPGEGRGGGGRGIGGANNTAGVGGAPGAAGRGRGGATAAELAAIPPHPDLAATSRWTQSSLTVEGTVVGKSGQAYKIEVFVSKSADRHTGSEKGWGEGERFLGIASALADVAGKAAFRLRLEIDDLTPAGTSTTYITATATDPGGSTSKFSKTLVLTQTK